jgi:hypothetical protein
MYISFVPMRQSIGMAGVCEKNVDKSSKCPFKTNWFLSLNTYIYIRQSIGFFCDEFITLAPLQATCWRDTIWINLYPTIDIFSYDYFLTSAPLQATCLQNTIWINLYPPIDIFSYNDFITSAPTSGTMLARNCVAVLLLVPAILAAKGDPKPDKQGRE